MGDFSVNVIFQLKDGTYDECIKNTWHEYINLIREKKLNPELKRIMDYSLKNESDLAEVFWINHKRSNNFNMVDCLKKINSFKTTSI
jgi:hypothetical protein